MLTELPKPGTTIIYQQPSSFDCSEVVQEYIVLGEWSKDILAICRPEDFEEEMLEIDPYNKQPKYYAKKYSANLDYNLGDKFTTAKVTTIIWMHPEGPNPWLKLKT